MVLHILRLTTTYDTTEDRLLLRVEDRAQQVARLWLTRRLADRLLQTLIAQLEQTVRAEDPALCSPAPVRAAGQVYAQLEARLARRPAPAVACPADSPSHLLTCFQLTITGRHWRIGCATASGRVAELDLSRRALRQWLEALQVAYRDAGWVSTVWPAWLEGGARRDRGRGC